jgi:hypothetical protein
MYYPLITLFEDHTIQWCSKTTKNETICGKRKDSIHNDTNPDYLAEDY